MNTKGQAVEKEREREIAMPELHMGQIHRENRQPASSPRAKAFTDGSLLQ